MENLNNNIALTQGDCMELINDIPDNSIDLIITDPPYKFSSVGGGFYANDKSDKRMYCDKLNNLSCTEFKPIPFLEQLKPKMKKFYGYFFCNKTLVDEYIGWAKKNKFNYDILVMAKSNPIPSFNFHHLSDLEYIIMIRDKGTYFSKHKNLDDFRKFYMTSCKKGIHPSEKPVELIERFMRVSSKDGDTILDPFMGSGTTGVACVNINRKFVGMELDEKYYKIAKERIVSTIDKEVHIEQQNKRR